jgi:MazG family protein
MASEAGHFEFKDVVEAISSKMRRRHPHVFAGALTGNAEEMRHEWERHKAAERSSKLCNDTQSLMDGVARALPALTRAGKLQKRAAKTGFDWPHISGVFDKVREELDEVSAELQAGLGSNRVREEIGDLLFSCVNLARHAGVDAEFGLREANERFEHRFRRMEEMLANQGSTAEEASLEEMDDLWERVKAESRSP